MQTPAAFIRQMDEPEGTNLLRNLIAQNGEDYISDPVPTDLILTVGEFILFSFDWKDSVEGEDYWESMLEKYNKVELNKFSPD